MCVEGVGGRVVDVLVDVAYMCVSCVPLHVLWCCDVVCGYCLLDVLCFHFVWLRLLCLFWWGHVNFNSFTDNRAILRHRCYTKVTLFITLCSQQHIDQLLPGHVV